jgi:hypothetical protein
VSPKNQRETTIRHSKPFPDIYQLVSGNWQTLLLFCALFVLFEVPPLPTDIPEVKRTKTEAVVPFTKDVAKNRRVSEVGLLLAGA